MEFQNLKKYWGPLCLPSLCKVRKRSAMWFRRSSDLKENLTDDDDNEDEDDRHHVAALLDKLCFAELITGKSCTYHSSYVTPIFYNRNLDI